MNKTMAWVAILSIFLVSFAVNLARAEDRRIIIINETHKRITAVYMSNVHHPDRRFNMLQTVYPHYLAPGERGIFNADDGSGLCMFNLIAVSIEGDVAEKDEVNVCEALTWTIRE